ncbi:PQQ-dependent sugar dehydrogenase [Cellvibrio sp. ARAG 10.3]|uniref:PQQ-dependent sugar dehydrogenase n=1 Tax=Cellvibrio sp. ARAG 10.3 TaxID=3451358 RepID=UPI003F47D178
MRFLLFFLSLSLSFSSVSTFGADTTRGRTIEAESLNHLRSSNFNVSQTEAGFDYVGHIDDSSILCYDNIDMSGVRSIEFVYARGPGAYETGRVAILVSPPNGLGKRTNLGEFETADTGDWETFQRQRVGLTKPTGGRHNLCFFGVTGGGIFNLDKFTLSSQPGENLGITKTFADALPGVLGGAGYRFELEVVGEAPNEIWSMAFLPDGDIVAAQKNGYLLRFRDGRQSALIEGLPDVWNRGQGGLMAIQPHPEYPKNGWLYLTYSHGNNDGKAMTVVARGKISGQRWQDHEIIYRAPDAFYSESNSHFGSRLVFKDGYIFFSVGERVDQDKAQDLGSPLGKIHRLHDDGRVPNDNPFVKTEGALATIWSYGHRNPQGMTLSPDRKHVWAVEHGPRGGDELNLIRKGRNYGWPLVSFGTNYDGTLISESPWREGTEPPVQQWTPSLGVSQAVFYTGNQFPLWRNQLLVASLGQQQLRMVKLDNNNKLVSDTLILQNLGRIRDVVSGPDGYPYLVISHPYGKIYRLTPVK